MTSSAARTIASASFGSSVLELDVHERRGLLHERQGVKERGRHAFARDGEVLEAPLGLGAPEGVGGHLDGAEGVFLDSRPGHRAELTTPASHDLTRQFDQIGGAR
jgi:hypothetical protein